MKSIKRASKVANTSLVKDMMEFFTEELSNINNNIELFILLKKMQDRVDTIKIDITPQANKDFVREYHGQKTTIGDALIKPYTKSPKYEYSKEITKMEILLKQSKELERLNGTAKAIVNTTQFDPLFSVTLNG